MVGVGVVVVPETLDMFLLVALLKLCSWHLQHYVIVLKVMIFQLTRPLYSILWCHSGLVAEILFQGTLRNNVRKSLSFYSLSCFFWAQVHDDIDHGQHEGLTRAQGTFGHDDTKALYAEDCEGAGFWGTGFRV